MGIKIIILTFLLYISFLGGEDMNTITNITNCKIDKFTDLEQEKSEVILYDTNTMLIKKTDEGYVIHFTNREEVNEFIFDESCNFIKANGKQKPIALTRSDIINGADRIKTIREMNKVFGVPHADIGSGFYIPTYISIDGTIIHFICSGDSITGYTCLDINGNVFK